MLKFKKKNKPSKVDINSTLNLDKKNIKDTVNVFDRGIRSIKDLIAPSVDRSSEDHIVVNNKYVRNFVMQGYPANVSIGWLDALFNYEGNLDTAIYIEPSDERTALDSLTDKITQFEAQLAIETEKGNMRNYTRLKNSIMKLYEEREKLEQNVESLFHIQITSNLYTDSLEKLEKETQKIDNKLKGRKIFLMPTYLRQDDGYKSVLPYGKTYLDDKFRNFSSGALTACFPFYNSDISHDNGTFVGKNLSTWTPIYIDFYDKKKLNNANMTVIGQAGSGKTFFVSLLTMRSVLKGIRSVIIDPEGEYKKVTEAVGGTNIYLSTDKSIDINAFDIEEEDVLDDDGIPTGEKIVNIKEKVSDLLNLIGVMAGGLSQDKISIISFLLQKLYEDREFTEDPKSLYVTKPYFDEATGNFYHDGMKKLMPRFSDFHESLEKYANAENDMELKKLAKALLMFKQGGIYDIFDCYTSPDLMDFKNAPVVTFDISNLEESILRPIGMYIALSWTWEKFSKKNPYIKKRVVCDEAWMLLNRNMKGYEYTSQFLETASRRIRKRNGGLLVASQNFVEFAENEKGRAVLTNSFVNIFLKQSDADIDAVQDRFKLSDGERMFLLQANKGEMLIRIGGESCIAHAHSFEYERKLIEKKHLS